MHGDRVPFVAPLRLRHLVWAPILGSIFVAATVWGTPHLRIRYVWNGNDRAPVYFSCEYWGIDPFSVRNALGGDCPIVVLARATR